jgi:hypothetical protein
MYTFSVWTQFTVQTGKRSELPRGMPLVTRVFASSEHAWDPMASSSVNFCRKTRTVPNVCQLYDELGAGLAGLQCLDAIYSVNW